MSGTDERRDEGSILGLRDKPRGEVKQQTFIEEIPLNNNHQAGSAGAGGPVSTRPTSRESGKTMTALITEEKSPKSPKHRSGGLWAAVVILGLALGAVTWYGALALRQNNITISQLPGVQRLITGLSGRMDATEARLRDLTINWGKVEGHVAELDRKLSSGLRLARKQTQELVDQAQARIEAEMGQHNQVIDARLSRLESGQQDERARLAQLQNEVQNQVSGVQQEVDAGQEESGRALAALRQEVDQNGNELSALNRKLDRQKVTFEASKGTPQELASGISVTVTKTNVRYQRFQGYLTLVNDGRTLWLPDVGAQQSVVFFPQQSSQPYDLVVTAVNANGVAGYLMVPVGGNRGQGTTTQDATGTAASAPGF